MLILYHISQCITTRTLILCNYFIFFHIFYERVLIIIEVHNNRIRELRKNLSLSQEALAEKIGTTQQAVSRMENNANDIPSDLLIEISKQFNVTTDYILGISDVKRDYNGQYRMNQEMDRCYDIVIRYQNLTEVNQKTLRCILERLEQAQKESGEESAKEERKNAESSNL